MKQNKIKIRKYASKNSSNAGFSLVELIVVILIIAIVAVSVTASIIHYVSKAGESVCTNNRSTIKTMLDVYMIEEEIDINSMSESEIAALIDSDDDPIQKNIKAYIDDEDGACPNGGTYELKAAGKSITVTCTKHSGEAKSLGASTDMSNVIDYFNKYLNVSALDSGAAKISNTSQSAKVKAELKDAGYDLDALGANNWKFFKNGSGNSVLQFTPIDISTLKDGDTTYVIQYRADSGNYTVWEAKISSNGSTGTSSEKYNVISSTGKGYTKSTATSENGNQTYEQALKYYEEAMKSKN